MQGEWGDESDERVLEIANTVDPDAFGLLFDRHRDRVFRQLLRRVGNPDDAEDVTALVFLEAWRKRRQVRVVDGSVLPWLLVVANNLAKNMQRSLRRYDHFLSRVPRQPDEPDHADEVLEGMDRVQRDSTVGAAFSRLSTRDQQILELCVIEELPVVDSAKALGISAVTARSRLMRAKRRLADLVGELDNQTAQPGAAMWSRS